MDKKIADKTTMQKSSSSFESITETDKLLRYLDDSSNRLKNTEFLHHYTTLSKAIQIIKSRYWHLGTAKSMNDKVEYENGDLQHWNNLFFCSFMSDVKESIAMWSMYSQPWMQGVKLFIPKKSIIKWIKDINELVEISTVTYQPTGITIPVNDKSINNGARLWISAVAYLNAESVEQSGDFHKITWSTVGNRNFINPSTIPELTGYIKDMAWSYEKEIRIKAELNNTNGIERVAIPLSDEIIDSIIITAGPLFEGDLQDEIEKEIDYSFKLEKSLFWRKLQIKSICSDCPNNKGNII